MLGSLEVRIKPSLLVAPRPLTLEIALKAQQHQIERIQEQLSPLSASLDEVAAIEAELIESNIEENDHTVFTHQDLDFELKLVQQTVVKKIKFLDNQVFSFAGLEARCLTNES
jgi:cofilin